MDTETAIASIVDDARDDRSTATGEIGDVGTMLFHVVRMLGVLSEEVSCLADELRGIKQAIADHQEGK